MLKDALLINSYGGSILAACMELGVPIRGSYETDGYGLEVQRFNAPNVNFISQTKDWPAQDLSQTLVIGHPPCSAFSGQNSAGRKAVGKDSSASIKSAAFKCTLDLLEYAKDAAMVMIESVPRAMEEARKIHDDFATDNGFLVYRIMQNACMFGLPQDRKRFWIIFAREPLDEVVVPVPSKLAAVHDFVKFDGDIHSKESLMQFKRAHDKLIEAGASDEAAREVMRGLHGFGRYDAAAKKAFKDLEFKLTGYSTRRPRLLDPEGLAPVVLYDSCWVMDGKLLTLPDFMRIMGYPDWWRMPSTATKSMHKAMGYLSRGVCPPIVEWLISNFAGHLVTNTEAAEKWLMGQSTIMTAGEVLEILPTKQKIKAAREPRIKEPAGPPEVNSLAPKAVIA